MRAQLRRATERYECMNSKKMLSPLSQPMEKETQVESEKCVNELHTEQRTSMDNNVPAKAFNVLRSDSLNSLCVDETRNNPEILRISCSTPDLCLAIDNHADEQENRDDKGSRDIKKPDVVVIPDDYLCPISLELMRDPVIVATGQV